MTDSRCVVCGTQVIYGEICKACEEETLRAVKERARILSTVATVFLLLVVFAAWSVYGPVVMEMDASTLENLPFSFEVSFEILRSPGLFTWMLVGFLLVFFAVLYEMFFKQIFLSGFKSYLS